MAARKIRHPVDAIVGANVRLYRRRQRMSQEDLAARLDLTFQQVQKYESGANRISASKLFEITKALGCAPNDLFDGVMTEPKSWTRAAFSYIDHARDIETSAPGLLTDLHRLTGEQRRHIAGTVAMIVAAR